MILKKINLKNFLSHDDTEISLSDNQKFLLDGKSGAGKSAIIDALVWALYGRGRTENRSLIKRGKKYAKVIVTLKDKEDIEYNIARSITIAGKHDLSVVYKKTTGKQFLPVKASGIKNLQEYIEKQILHSSYLLFLNSIIYPQDNIDSFVKQTAAKRKEIILEIVNASDYDEYYEKAKDKIKELEISVGGTEVAITGIENKIKSDKETLSDLSDLNKKLDKVKELESGKKIDLQILSEWKSKYDLVKNKKEEKEENIPILHEKIQKLIVEIEELNYKKDLLSSTDIDKLKEKIEENKKRIIQFKKLTIEINTWNEKMMELINFAPVDKNYEEIEQRINSQIIDLMRKDVETCPEIGKSCPVIVKEKDKKIAELSNSLDEIMKEKKEYLEKRADYNKKVNDLGEKPTINNIEFSEIELLVKKLEEELKEVEQGSTNIIIEISVKEKEIEALKEEKSKMLNEKLTLESKLDKMKMKYSEDKVKEAEIEYENLVSQNRGLSQEIAVTENNILRIKEEEKRLKSMKENVKEDQDILKSLKLLKEAFGNNGVKAIIIDYVIPKMEDRINEILSRLSDFRIRLDTQTKTTSGESIKEGLYIDILTPNGEQLSYNNFSGGEKVKISSAIFEGLASFQHCNFRIFDESIVSLDNESTIQFIDVIKDIQKNVNQMIVISHIQEVKDCFIDKINVTKNDGISIVN